MAAELRISEWIEANIVLSEGVREFAIGDVHGYSNMLEPMLHAMGRASDGQGHLTYLGDLCDRGPDTLGCYRLAFGDAPEDQGFAGRTALIGNHEGMMLATMLNGPETRQIGTLWLDNGGDTVMRELGLNCPGVFTRDIEPAMRSALSDHIVDQIIAMQGHRQVGGLLFVHAGINPALSLPELVEWLDQPKICFMHEDHYTWIRAPFWEHQDRFDGDMLVVHGHTPEYHIRRWKQSDAADIHRIDGWRLGLDGGSYRTGIIAGAEFRNGAYRVYTVQQ